MVAQNRLKRVAKELDAEGMFPSPKALLERLGRDSQSRSRGGPTLNGEESRARIEVLEEMGYTKDLKTGRWHKKERRP